MSVKKLGQIISNLFSQKEVTEIKFSDMLQAEKDVWFYINDNKIRYKFIQINSKQIISITEWLEDDTFHLHVHYDCDEMIFIICGYLKSILDGLIRTTFQKIGYKAGTIHSVYGTKGTKIAVKFDKIKL